MRKLFILAALMASTTAFAKKKNQRPDPMSVGIGAGLSVPSSPIGIDVGSVRVRLTDQITIEPSITYTSDKTDSKVKVSDNSSTSSTTSSTTGLDALVRYTLADNGPVDFQLLGGLGYGSGKSEVDPDGKDNNTTTEASGGTLDLGIGLETFFKGHYSLSADALTRMYYSQKSSQTDEAGDTTIDSETSGFALPLDPTIRVMFHVYL